jgi:NDP-sugar pyrophosphorylase family protein
VILQQGVTAGKTPVGSKIQAKLGVSTLVDGTVIPRNAVFWGEVIESVAKKGPNPSRVSVRMDSVQWKNGSAALKVYLTAWYYPARDQMGQNLEYGPQQPKVG